MITPLLLVIALQADFCQPHKEDQQIFPSAGLIIAIDPDQLFSDGLVQAWNCIDEPYANRHVQSQPLAKVNFTLQPQPSADGAAVFVHGKGTSAGETKTISRNAAIHSNSLTSFEFGQFLNIKFDGIGRSQPNIHADAKQSLNHVDSNKPFGGLVTNVAFKRRPEEIKAKADTFAKIQLHRQLDKTIDNLAQNVQQGLLRLQAVLPSVADVDWQLSSDDKKIYAASGFDANHYEMIHQPGNSPVEVLFHEKLAATWLNKRFGGQTVTSTQIRVLSKSMNFKSKLVSEKNATEKPWSITFLDRAADVKFQDDRIDIRIGVESFEFDERVLPAIAARFIYRIEQNEKNGSQLNLVRDGDIEIHGDISGARQQILRSIFRKRMDSILPDSFAVKFPNAMLRRMQNVDLSLHRVTTQNSCLNISLNAD